MKKRMRKRIQTNVVKRIRPEEKEQIMTCPSKRHHVEEAASQITFHLELR